MSRYLVLLLLWFQFGCSASKKASEVLPVAKEGYVESSDGVRIFYRIMGSGGDTVVIIHGGPGLTMDYFYEDLAPMAANNTLLFFDQRGAGRSTLVSDSSALDAQRFVDDVEALRKHFGLARVSLFGHSWGAAPTALYAIRYPQHLDKLIVVGGLPLQYEQFAEILKTQEAMRDSSELKLLRELKAARMADPANAQVCRDYYVVWFRHFTVDPRDMSKSKGDFCSGTMESRRNKMLAVDRYTMASLGAWDWRSSLAKVQAPTLVIHGVKDPLSIEGGRAWARTIPNARILELQNVGHFPYLEAPGKFFKAVDKFLREN